ncbi:ERF family protein [Lactiplantibacillus pentosus]|uniref:ERF family protein n=1 Tax=Lactiplantibacillus pentosus TaxID=1589 RepID=UPI001FD680CB|nr:ERF family protein [Lactiplantibacillus pentosus]MCJ8184782.1 ERF family protein [Lactiplantibacillus pentosus]
MSESDSIYTKLQHIHEKVRYIQKSSQSSQYTYASSSDVIGQIHTLMDEEKLILKPEIVGHTLQSSANKRGAAVYFTELELSMTWINTENPEERISSQWYAQGIDTAGEKGVGKALTYGEKYFLLKFFNIATDDADPDSFQQNIERQKQPEPVSSEQQKQLSELFEAMAGVTQTPVAKVRAGYLKKAGVSNVSQLTHDTANQLITVVTNQLNKQTEKAG